MNRSVMNWNVLRIGGLGGSDEACYIGSIPQKKDKKGDDRSEESFT